MRACMCLCVCLCMRTNACMFVHLLICTCMCLFMRLCVCAFVRAFVYLCKYVSVALCKYMFTQLHKCINAQMHKCTRYSLPAVIYSDVYLASIALYQFCTYRDDAVLGLLSRTCNGASGHVCIEIASAKFCRVYFNAIV